MKLTFTDYIQNPMGRNNPVYNLSVRESIRRDYTARWNALLMRENGKIKYTIYYDKKHNVYYAHFKIPSETIAKFYYDVVIRFFADENVKGGGANLDQYHVQFFSNDPAFLFNYAHAFMQNDLIIEDLKPRMSRQSIKKPAKEKNPGNLTGYVKTIYFVYLFMKERGLFSIVTLNNVKDYNKKTLLSEVQDTDIVVEKRQKEGEKQRKKEVKEKRESNKQVNNVQSYIGQTKSVGKVGTVKTMNTKRVSTTKTVKKR